MIFNLAGAAQDEYVYKCTGSNDNIAISNIVKGFLNGGSDYKTLRLVVTGNIGINGNAGGSGTSSSPYRVFDFNVNTNTRRVYIDFTNCSPIQPLVASGKYYYVFYTDYSIGIIGATVIASNNASGTTVRIFNSISGAIYAENCRFYITTYQYGIIGMNGTYFNCRGSVANSIENSYCFQPSTYGITRVYGGEYYAYTAASNKQSAILGQSSANSVCILYGVNAPQVARGGYYQTNSLLQWTGGGMLNCTDLVSPLPMVVPASINNIRGTITENKANFM